MKCPCCQQELAPTLDDAPFCWDCGLYERDDPAECDAEDHPLRTVDMLCVPGLGWPRAKLGDTQ